MLRRTFLSIPAVALAAEQRRSLRITDLTTTVTINPKRPPYYDALQTLSVNDGSVQLRILTDGGITGYATSSFGSVQGGPKVVQTILEEEIKPLLIGQDPAFPKKIRSVLHNGLQYQGLAGITQFAIAAADMPVYSMCGWYYDNDDDLSQYRKQIEAALQQGYRAIKIKVG